MTKKKPQKKSKKRAKIKHHKKNNKKNRAKFIILSFIALILVVSIAFLYNPYSFKKGTVSLVNFFTEECDWFGTLDCKDLTLYSNGTLKIRLINPSLNLSSANLILFDSQGNNFTCNEIDTWLAGTSKYVFCNVGEGNLGKQINLSFKFIYSPIDSPIYITETGRFITRYE